MRSFFGSLDIFRVKGSGTESLLLVELPDDELGTPAFCTRGDMGVPMRCPGRGGGYLGGWVAGTGGG